MNKKAYAFFLKKNRPRRHNPVVLDLNDGPYHQRVVKNKKIYDRKKLSKIQRGSSDGEMSDV